jgi:hypothetical protein
VIHVLLEFALCALIGAVAAGVLGLMMFSWSNACGGLTAAGAQLRRQLWAGACRLARLMPTRRSRSASVSGPHGTAAG